MFWQQSTRSPSLPPSDPVSRCFRPTGEAADSSEIYVLTQKWSLWHIPDCNQILAISIILPGLEEGDGLLEAAQVQHADRHVVDHDDVRLRGGRGGGGVRALQRGQGGREVAGRDGEHGGVEEAVDGALVAATCGGRPGLLGLFEIALRRLNVTCTRVD